MIINSIKYISLLLLLMSSCKGQRSSELDLVPHKPIPKVSNVSSLDDRIWVVFQDSKGRYWFGSNGEGLYLYDNSSLIRITTEEGLSDSAVRRIQEDHLGNIYIQCQDGQICKYDGHRITKLRSISLASNEWRLEPTDLWFGYNANDLYRYDGQQLYELMLPRKNLELAFGTYVEGVPFGSSNNSSPYAVYGIDKDKEGNIWIGTVTAGAFRYDGASFLWFAEKELSTLPDGRVPGVRSMLQDKNGDFWLSNVRSKYTIDSTAACGYKKMKAVDLAPGFEDKWLPYFNAGLVDRAGNLQMTTYGGAVWTYDGHKLTTTEVNNEKGKVLLVSIFEDKDGVLWLGTDNDGVYKQVGTSFEKFKPNIEMHR